jgi:cyclopropane-fatty-acyl-phospholipid synthase
MLIDHRISSADSDEGNAQAAARALQQSGLEAIDVQNLGRHYAATLRCWTERYEQHAERIRQTVGETKYRIWRVYLAGCTHAVSVGNASAHQIACKKAGGIASMRG